MSYVDAKDGARNRLVTGGVVGGLQIGLALAIVSGFAVSDLGREKDRPLPSAFFPAAPRPPEPVEPARVDPRPQSVASSTITAPEPRMPIATPRAIEVAQAVPTGPSVAYVPAPSVTPMPVAHSDPAPAFEPRVARPRGDVARWVTTNDYPSRELREGHEGLVRFRLSIDSRGRVQDCAILASSGYPALDAATCALASRRGRFEPASDENGAAISGQWDNAVRWVIPKD
ncbi:TonB family protein [Novosphingobium profundi]|uniref:energy transducer TonB n=1 Tax=Novosphingobium profundi TaxID=1774954 RepID=UPI001BDB5B93|nr:energy transducer TonB [Novosphingobium profundi]MBT0667899.1 TonB family protein [Novosphingobium profundi]